MTKKDYERTALVAIVGALAVFFASGCYSTHGSLDGPVRINRVTGEVCIYMIQADADGNRFVDVYCEE
jgi:hypothetical protein